MDANDKLLAACGKLIEMVMEDDYDGTTKAMLALVEAAEELTGDDYYDQYITKGGACNRLPLS